MGQGPVPITMQLGAQGSRASTPRASSFRILSLNEETKVWGSPGLKKRETG